MNTIEKNFIKVPRNIQVFLTPSAYMVFVDLIEKSNLYTSQNQSHFYTTYERISEFLPNLSVRTIKTCFKELVDFNLLSYTRRPNGLYVTINYNSCAKYAQMSINDVKSAAEQIILEKKIEKKKTETKPQTIEYQCELQKTA